MNRVDNEGDTRSRRDEQEDHPMSISGKLYQGRGSRASANFAKASDQWEKRMLGPICRHSRRR